jgi:hypothetical protein
MDTDWPTSVLCLRLQDSLPDTSTPAELQTNGGHIPRNHNNHHKTCTPRPSRRPSKFVGPANYKLRLLFRAVAYLFRILPPLLSPFDFFYFLEAVEPAAIDAGAFFRRLVPVARPSQVVRPEGPAPALAWTNRIYHTLFTAGDALQEYAVFGRMMLDNRRSQPHPFEVFPP